MLVASYWPLAAAYKRVFQINEEGNLVETSIVKILKDIPLTSCYILCTHTPLCRNVGFSRNRSSGLLIECYLIKENYDRDKTGKSSLYMLVNFVSSTHDNKNRSYLFFLFCFVNFIDHVFWLGSALLAESLLNEMSNTGLDKLCTKFLRSEAQNF